MAKRRRIHNTFEDKAHQMRKWKMGENDNTSDWVPSNCLLALVMKWNKDKKRWVSHQNEHRRWGWISVIGTRTGAVYFASGACINSAVIDLAALKALTAAVGDSRLVCKYLLIESWRAFGQAGCFKWNIGDMRAIVVIRGVFRKFPCQIGGWEYLMMSL